MKSIVSIILSISALVSMYAQEDMTLQKAISIGLENNFQIKIASQNVLIAENNNTWARAGRTPTVDLQGTFSNNLTRDNNPASFLQGTFYNGSLGGNINVGYVLYAGGRIGISKEILGLSTTQEQLNKQVQINDLITEIYQQYYNILLQNEREDVISYTYTLSQDKLIYEQTKAEYGASNSYNLVQFENATITDSINLINQRQASEIAQRQLYAVLNIKNGNNYTYPDRLSVVPETIDTEKLYTSIEEDNYTLKSLEVLAALNRLNTGLAKAANRPTLSLNASIGAAENAFKFFADNPNTGDPFPLIFSNRFTGGLGAQLTWNLYDGDVRNTDIQNAQIQEQIDQLSIEEAKVAIRNQIDILVDNYDNQRSVLQLTDRQIKLSLKNLEISEARFKTGQLTSIDYRNVQNQYLNAAFNKVNAMFDIIVTKSEIDNLIGKFGE